MRGLKLSLILLILATTATLTAQAEGQVCEGFAGTPCTGANEFCELPDGECCCDILGQCVEIPESCPAVFDPVCGCDGQTYSNRCESQRAQVSVDHPGPCFDETRLVTGLLFEPPLGFTWDVPPGTLSSNLYRKTLGHAPPQNFGHCLYADVSSPQAPVPGVPLPGELWLFQVTAMFSEGEGPMGLGSTGLVREPAAPCLCTLPADVGPCDGSIPRWFHNFQTDRCEPFTWGGCQGNANNFASREACEAACRATCGLPPDAGPCEALIPRWFYSRDTGRCARFIWGGCYANANNFPTLAECEATCPAP